MKKQVKFLTITLAIETESEDMDEIEAAVCSALADMPIDYDCEEDMPDSDEMVRVVVEGRIAIANTERCRVDAGVSNDYQHPGLGKFTRHLGGRTFVYGP